MRVHDPLHLLAAAERAVLVAAERAVLAAAERALLAAAERALLGAAERALLGAAERPVLVAALLVAPERRAAKRLTAVDDAPGSPDCPERTDELPCTP